MYNKTQFSCTTLFVDKMRLRHRMVLWIGPHHVEVSRVAGKRSMQDRVKEDGGFVMDSRCRVKGG
jgi:hypothetical protein